MGSVAGGVDFAAATAAGLTDGAGRRSYIAVLAKLFIASEGEAPATEAIAQRVQGSRMAKRGQAPRAGSIPA